jgi:hypothetical protein
MVSTKELDTLIEMLMEARSDYETAKRLAGERNETVELLEEKLMQLLDDAEKSVYVSDRARVTVVSKLQVTTPKTPEDKKSFFEWLKNKHGVEAMYTYMTVNHNSLNSLYNTEVEQARATGGLAIVDGIDAPTVRKSLQLRAGK